MALLSANDLFQYSLKKLGSPVVNIEIDPLQGMDRIDEAVRFFIERHFNGVEEVHYKHAITHTEILAGSLSVPHEYVALTEVLNVSTNSIEKLFDFQYQTMVNINDQIGRNTAATVANYYITMSNVSQLQNLITPLRNFEYNSASNNFIPKFQLSDAATGNLFTNATVLDSVDWSTTNSTIAASNVTNINGVALTGSTLTSAGAGSVSISQNWVTTQYVRGTFTVKGIFKAGTLAGNITLNVTDANGNVVFADSTYTPTSIWESKVWVFTCPTSTANDLNVSFSMTATAANEIVYIDGPQLYANSYLILHGYRNLNPLTSPLIYDDNWVRRYATALIKQQWGTNLKKYDGVQLAGSLTLNGQVIYDEASNEIEKLLEDFSLAYEEMPTGFWA
ncbi:MAG: hypothetical protein R8M45_10725 [Ghiorsea sp.]